MSALFFLVAHSRALLHLPNQVDLHLCHLVAVSLRVVHLATDIGHHHHQEEAAMEDEVEGKMMSMCRVMLTPDRDRVHQHRGGGSDRTAIQDLRLGHHHVDEVPRQGARQGARQGDGDGAQATAPTVATVGAEVGLGVEREAEEDMGEGEVVMSKPRCTNDLAMVLKRWDEGLVRSLCREKRFFDQCQRIEYFISLL